MRRLACLLFLSSLPVACTGGSGSPAAPTPPVVHVTCTLAIQHVENVGNPALAPGDVRVTWAYSFSGVSTASVTSAGRSYGLPFSPGVLTVDYLFTRPNVPNVSATLTAGTCVSTQTAP